MCNVITKRTRRLRTDKSGQRYGHLEVLYPTEYSLDGSSIYVCLCHKCGDQCEVPACRLFNRGNTSCGCNRWNRQHIGKDMVGKRFGMLLVESRAVTQKSTWHWNCLCDCGERVVVCGAELRKGTKTHCGCSSKRGIRHSSEALKPGDRSGMLTLIRPVRVTAKTKTKDGTRPAWLCSCDCGNTTTVPSTYLRASNRRVTRSCGCLSDIRREERKGKNHPSYNPDLTDDQRTHRAFNRANYKWTQLVLKRDKCCQRCGSTERPHVHHIYPYAWYPNLRTEPTNGIVLCNDCHRAYHHQHGNKKCNANQISNFIGRRIRVKKDTKCNS
jgi:hypothetical protein